MDKQDRLQIRKVLRRIPRREWNRFLRTADGLWLDRRMQAVNEILDQIGSLGRGARSRPSTEILDALGQRLLSNEQCGFWLREQILRQLPARRWEQLAGRFNALAGKSAWTYHGNMTQAGKGSEVLASYWRVGSRWAYLFCEAAGLPESLARRQPSPLPDDEEIFPVQPLPPLHDFQLDVYQTLRKLFASGRGKTGLLSLPTGAGKTRVAVEAVCDHLATQDGDRKNRNLVIWIAQSHELQVQAWECFWQVWQVPPQRLDGSAIRRQRPLLLQRAWGSKDPDQIVFNSEPTILIAGIDQLASWVHRRPDFFERLPERKLLCTILDEAHSAVTDETRDVLVALGHRSERFWRPRKSAAPLIGLTATPWRSGEESFKRLKRYFQKRLVRPGILGERPIETLQESGVLARVTEEQLSVTGTAPMSAGQQSRLEKFGDLPSDYVAALGEETRRNAQILARLRKIPKASKVIVFACSIVHAEILTTCLNRAYKDNVAASITTDTPRTQRVTSVERFRYGDLRFLVTVGVLAAGFDAPKTDVVCVTRPTMSAARYEQMVGRGLRGPLNGGKEECLVLNVQDEGLPQGIQSYARVVKLWR